MNLPSEEDTAKLCLPLEIPLDTLQQTIRLQDHDFAELDTTQEYRAQRTKVLERAFQLPRLREVLAGSESLKEKTRTQVQHMIFTLSRLASGQGDLAQKPGQA